MKAQIDLSVDFQKWGYMCTDQYIRLLTHPFFHLTKALRNLVKLPGGARGGGHVLCDVRTKTLFAVEALKDSLPALMFPWLRSPEFGKEISSVHCNVC